MITKLAKKIFGSANDRYISKLSKIVNKINEYEPDFEKLNDDELKNKTLYFKNQIKEGWHLDDILPEAFAAVREVGKRKLGLRLYDVQLIGGYVLHKGMIAEMKTGEGKTFVATLAAYLNALEGKGVHIVTVNDYLAKRDSEWMGEVYKGLGLSVGCILHNMNDAERKEAYAFDITYGTNNEFGFDYLRDNMKFRLDDMVQKNFNYAIVDEVDSILIDEARTPLIISGPAEDSSATYMVVDEIIPLLKDEHFEKDEKQKNITLTESGITEVENLLRKNGIIAKDSNMFDINNVSIVHHVNQALRAHKLFTKDVDYVVKDNKIIIIDEFTGRMMEGRRYSEGLHQALEAKEGVKVQSENQTLASITFQNYFRMYPKLAGMTGTAMTEASEFVEIYGLETIAIPTNKPVVRIDNDDEIYRTAKEKYTAIINAIKKCHEKGQPILVGTTSIEKSEHLAELLKKETNFKFNILNARHHEQEAYIIAQAGRPNAITIATNMAGRGTDIQLGGNLEMRIKKELANETDENKIKTLTEKIKTEILNDKEKVIQSGGLFILGTERHESRRIDNQLRGRSGRQGDPGETKFFLSLEDDLMRIFGSERISSILQRLGLEENEAIIHPWINKAIEKAQQKVEEHNFDIRKNLLKYDNVMNDQRKVIYTQRKELMETEDVSGTIDDMSEDLVIELVQKYAPEKTPCELWDMEGLANEYYRITNKDIGIKKYKDEDGLDQVIIKDRLLKGIDDHLNSKEAKLGFELMRLLEKSLLLQLLDHSWKEHLLALDSMRHTIVLRAYGQKDPLNEYKQEAFTSFRKMLEDLKDKIITILCHVEMREKEKVDLFEESKKAKQMRAYHEDPKSLFEEKENPQNAPAEKQVPFKHENFDFNNPETWGRIPRNAPCPCGSGKKFKHCHGQIK